MKEKLVSVVVPVYNAELTIRRCVESILKQDYPLIELILVNDGSTDNSLSILEEYENEYPNVMVVSQSNQGVSGARNTGIKKANGEYICFIDSDDYIESDFCSYMLPHFEDSDIVVGGRNSYVDGVYLKSKCAPRVIKESGEESIKKLLLGKYNAHMICPKMFRTSIFVDNNVLFPNNLMFEDLYLAIDTFLIAKRITYVDKNLYMYMTHDNSILTTVSEKYVVDYIKVMEHVLDQIKSLGKDEEYKSEVLVKLQKGLDRINRHYVNSTVISETCFKVNIRVLLRLIDEWKMK